LPTATLPTSKILIHQFLQTMRMRNCSERTIRSWQYILVRFIQWCGERGIECVGPLTSIQARSASK
jgi:site-specific recombinase XerD